ncbi:MAG: hypothetical protein AAGA54_09465 [Myxococcota bacterium]
MQTVHRTIVTANGPRRALVVSPDEDEIVGPKTLEELRSGAKSLHHEHLADVVLSDEEPTHAVILRARGAEGSGQFRMARDLDDGQLEEVGYLLARAQLNAWRPLLQRGVLTFARVELRVWELAAMRSGTARLLAELDARRHDTDASRSAQARYDHWTLGNALLNFGVGLDTALSELLPMRLEQLEQQRPSGPAANAISL